MNANPRWAGLVYSKPITPYSTMSQSISQLVLEMWWKIKHILFKVDFEIVWRQPIIIVYPLCLGLICTRSQTILIFVGQFFQEFVSSLPCPPRIIFCLLPWAERAWPWPFHFGWLLMEDSLNGLHTAAISPPFPYPIVVYTFICCVLFCGNLKQYI